MVGPKKSQKHEKTHSESDSMGASGRSSHHDDSDASLQFADFSPDALFEISTDGRLTFASKAAETVFGRTIDAQIGTSFLEFIVPEDRERLLASFQKAIETGAEPTLRFGAIRGDGVRVSIESRTRVYRQPGGGQRIFVSCRDISEEMSARAAERTRLEHYRTLVESGRPAAIMNSSGEVLFSNRKFRSLRGGTPNVAEMKRRLSLETRAKVDAQLRLSERGDTSGSLDFQVADERGVSNWLTTTWESHRSDNGERLFTVQYGNINHRKNVEKALSSIAGLDVYTSNGQVQIALDALAEALEFDRLVFAELTPERPGTAKIIGGRDGDGGEAGHTNPAGEVLQLEGLPDAATARGETCIHPLGLQRILPQLSERLGSAYEAYAGLPIFLKDGSLFGFVAGYRRTAIKDLDLTRTLLKLFAERVSISESYRRNEESLRTTQTRFAVITDHSPDLLIESDDQFRILYISEACRTILGRSPEEFVGRRLLDFVHAEDLREVMRAASEFAIGRADDLYVCRSQHVDGSWRTLEARSVPYQAPDGGRRSIILLRDITERQRKENALRDRELRLDDASRMEAVGRLAGGIAHDFNNLLTAIIGYSDLVLDHVGPTSVAYDDAQEVLRAAERAGALTRQLLTFSRRHVTQQKPIDLNSVLAEIDRMIRRVIPENIEVVTHQSGDLHPVLADQGHLEQLLMNLVVNACDAMPTGGQLSIETSTLETEAAVSTRSGPLDPGVYTVLTVRDTGAGIEEQTLSRVFEPFFTTKDSDSGTGLGLATVLNIMRESRGQIDIETSRGRGSSFSAYFPVTSRAVETTELEGRDEIEARKAAGGNETVLIVEDEEAILALLARTLARGGYEVLAADSATAALRHCARHEGHIDLMLTDVVLPKASGAEVARRAVSLRPDLRILFMSGFPDETLEQHGLSRATVQLLDKPFSPSNALHAVRTALDQEPLQMPATISSDAPDPGPEDDRG